jgi:3-hydroxyisobutyrate dehydrogenase-like beta-hydroxyacid dehydrogenase
MDIAVLGMGRMGRALAGRLLEGGHRLTVWNRTKGRAGELVSAGAPSEAPGPGASPWPSGRAPSEAPGPGASPWPSGRAREAESVADAVRGVEVAITSLANDDAVRAVALGELRSSIDEATTYVDSSTVSPKLSGELAEAFPRFAAMPILGSPAAVRAGQATFLVGGKPEVVDGLAPVLSSLSESVRRYDTAPPALTAKLASNLLLLAGVVALAESFAVGRSGGLSDDQLRDLLGNSPLVAPGLKNRFEGVLAGSMEEPWWTTVLGAKDAGLAVGAAREAGVELPEAQVVRQLYEKAASLGLADADIVAVANLCRSPARAASKGG